MENIIITLLVILVLCAILVARKDKKYLLNVVYKNKENGQDMVNGTLEYRKKDLELKEEILSTLKRIEIKINNNL